MYRVTVSLPLLLAVAMLGAEEIPERPEKLQFPPLGFEIPEAESMRFELENGTPVYALPNRQLPLIDLRIFFRGGQYLEPAGREGLATVAGQVWRSGGAGDRSARELDEALDFLAADLSTRIGATTGSVWLNVLSKDLEPGLALMMDVLTKPRFQQDRVDQAKDDLIQEMKTRNDSTAAIEIREWRRLIYGGDYFLNRLPTRASVDAMTADDCRRFVTSLARSGNLVVAVAGDFDVDAIKPLLERSVGRLPAVDGPIPPVPQPDHAPEPGVYLIHKQDVNQGHVRMGHLGYRLGTDHEFALRVVNRILGGGDFTSRIVQRVRSDEGLAYDAWSVLRFPADRPGSFAAGFQSKSSTCAHAAAITRGLIAQVTGEPVTADELATSVNYYVESFPRRFESPAVTASRYALDELEGIPHGYWSGYRERMRSLSIADLEKAGREKLHPERMIVLVVGNIPDILEGHPDHEARFEDFGELRRLPLRDPLTLEPIE